MPFDKSSLPYHYETEYDPVILPNGVRRQLMWHYNVAQSAQVSIQKAFYPLLVERVRRLASYTLDDYVITYATIHEWQYIDTEDIRYPEAVYGYRFYRDGSLTKGDHHHLQPEAAVMLGYTPDVNKIPAYIDITPANRLQAVLDEAHERMQDSGTLNAWLSPPVDAPQDAPPDINHVLKQMRGDIGIKTPRGRGRMLQYIADETGVVVGQTGWGLTDDEYTRRQQATANA